MLTSSSSGELISRVGYDEAFRIFHEAGLEAMDFPVDHGTYNVEQLNKSENIGRTEEETFEKYSAIKKIADKYNVKIGQTHSIFGNYEMANTPEFHQILINDIAATAALGCNYTVVHPVKIPGRILDEKQMEGFEYNLNFFRSLIPYCKKYSVKIAIENMFVSDENGKRRATQCSDPNELYELYRVLGDDCFCTCADTGHFSLTAADTGYSVGDCIRVLGKSLKVLHIQETDLVDDFHTVPYTFKDTMDWEDIYSALKEINYQGIVNFEVMPHLAKYPNCPEMNFEAMRHISAIAHYAASRIEG